ncbi:MAG: hypothetical protein C4308_03335 [Chitinophagaceae bacterium]
MEYYPQGYFQQLSRKIKLADYRNLNLQRFIADLWQEIKYLGVTEELDDYEKRKLSIFNQLNFFQFLTGILLPVMSFFNNSALLSQGWLIASLPACISIAVLVLNHYRRYQAAKYTYFILYPIFICFSYIGGMHLGVELSFVLFGILSVFFLQDAGFMIFSICLSMVSYFMLSVVWKDYPYEMAKINFVAYLVNQVIAIVYIFYGLYLIKKENANYQFQLLTKHRKLHKQNLEIAQQKKEMDEKALLLQKQAEELAELNALKNKLFSIISHDMRAPLYALKNLFTTAQQYNMPAKQLKEMLPNIVNDLNYATGLMENLLHWSKNQMQSNKVNPQKLDLCEMIHNTVQLLNLQSQAKKIYIDKKTDMPTYAWGDRDMINTVLRNLLSNAIKFTPEGGSITIGVQQYDSVVEAYVKDTGRGIAKEDIIKIFQKNYFSTQGTAREQGTGLGLMLCKEFLEKNGGRMMIQSEPGIGSTFSFTLPQI